MAATVLAAAAGLLWSPAARAAQPLGPPELRQSLPPARARPPFRVGAALGGGLPAAGTVILSAEQGVWPLLAVRASAVGLFGQAWRHAPATATGLLLAGPSASLDALTWVPRLALLGGLQVWPVAPAVQLNATLDRFVSLRASVALGVSATWAGRDHWRGDCTVGIGWSS